MLQIKDLKNCYCLLQKDEKLAFIKLKTKNLIQKAPKATQTQFSN